VSEDVRQVPDAGATRVTGYCILRLPVKDLKRSLAFYCDVIGYACPDRDVEVEALVEPARGTGPGLFLMQATADEFCHIHWEQWGETYTAFELFVDDVHALHQRLLEAGATVREPSYRGDYLTLGFFDPDGHFLFAVDASGRYFTLKPQLERLLGRPLTEREDSDLKRVCAATVGHDELWIIQSLLAGIRDPSVG
jgi:catechol 2,3-dioxygenase-like lactoylglutathione lyase family enzyme